MIILPFNACLSYYIAIEVGTENNCCQVRRLFNQEQSSNEVYIEYWL